MGWLARARDQLSTPLALRERDSMCLSPPVILREFSGCWTIFGGKKGRWGGKATRDKGAPEKVSPCGVGWVRFSISRMAPPPSDFKHGIFPSRPLCQAWAKPGLYIVHPCVCARVCVFFPSWKNSETRQLCQQLLFLSQRGACKP